MMEREPHGPSGPAEIVMLVPHDPYVDPRIQWVIGLCRDLARTDVHCLVPKPIGPAVTWDGLVRVEQHRSSWSQPRRTGRIRRFFFEWATSHAAHLERLCYGPGVTPMADRFGARPLAGHAQAPAWPGGLAGTLSYHVGGALHAMGQYLGYCWLIDSMRALAKKVSGRPRLVICHDLWALDAGLDLKRRCKARLLYDSHEWHPQASLAGHPLEQWFTGFYEGRLARQVDAVIAVSPPLVDAMRSTYRLSSVHCVPNAEPLPDAGLPPPRADVGNPVRFIVQGGACPGRGFESLLEGWRRLDDARGVLLVRCPASAYLDGLAAAHADLVARGRVQFLPAVKPDELVAGASVADVGIIPYPVRVGEHGLNLNHLYCCPNKLSQYMQAGLALLCSDSVYLSDRLARYGCGLTYDPDRPETLAQAARKLLDDPAEVIRMRQSARRWAVEEFNWAVQSRPYRELIEQFVGRSADNARPAGHDRRAA